MSDWVLRNHRITPAIQIQTISGGAAKLKNFRKALERNDFFVFPIFGVAFEKILSKYRHLSSEFSKRGSPSSRLALNWNSVSFRRKLLIEILFKSFGWYRFSKLSLYFSILISTREFLDVKATSDRDYKTKLQTNDWCKKTNQILI